MSGPEVKARRTPAAYVYMGWLGVALLTAFVSAWNGGIVIPKIPQERVDAAIGFVVIGAIVCVYFLPAIVARNRNHSNAGAIYFLNLLFGWTFIGWGVALVWAMTDNVRKP
jgi:hypothetical protein